MRFVRDQREHLAHVDLTPLIDIIFLLIIFFMTTAQFIERARAELELPQERGEDTEHPKVPPLVVNVLTDGPEPFIVGERRYSLRGVEDLIDREVARLRTEGKSPGDLELTIRADHRGSSRAVNDLGRFLRERGILRWRLATEPP